MDIRVKQRDATDCGAACIASVAKYYGLDLQVAHIRQRAGTDKTGTNVLGMIEAAESFGLDAKGVKGPFESLFNVPLPAIAHISINAALHHFVVISRLTKDEIIVMDPADGNLHRKDHNEFIKEWTGILVLLMPSDDFKPRNEKTSLIWRLWSFVKPHRGLLIQALFGAFVYTVLGFSASIFIQVIIDHVLAESNHTLLNLMGIAMIFLLLLRTLVGVFKNIFILRIGQMIDSRLILGYYKHLLKLPQQFFDTMQVGEITSRVNDAVKIRVFLNDVLINVIICVFMFVSSLTLMFVYYWKLALLMSLIVPVYCLIYFITNNLNKTSQRELMENSAKLETQLIESLNAIGTVKRFALERYSNNKTEFSCIKLLRTVYRSGINSLFAGTSTEFTSQLFIILLLWIGSGFVISREISPGELLSFYTLIGCITVPVSSLIGMNRIAQDAIIATDRLFEIMDLEREAEPNGNQIELTVGNLGSIRFKDLSFRYGFRTNVFSNLNLEIPLTGMTAVVGESGCGKSTLAALIHNIYPASEGNIYVGDHSIRYITNRSLREIIAVVPQVTDLFSGSILNNLTIGRKDVDMQKVLRICKELGVLDFIESLPEGFQTNIGRNGVTLSGGQKQRIAIARALYRDPEILILDEATSSLDPSSEQYVQDTIHSFLKQGKTVIIIAHRLSMIHKADKIILLKNGSVKEEGTHSELMALRSEYYSLWTKHLAQDVNS